MYARFCIILLFIPIFAFSFMWTLLVEMKSGVWYAWNDAMSEADLMRRSWKAKKLLRR